MTWLAALRRRWSAIRRADDAGITLIEVVVSLTIMSITMAIFTTGIVSIFRAQNKTESASTAQTRVNLAFLRLDKQLRYASDISSPGQYNSNWRVEYLLTNAGTAECIQLQLDVASGELQQRSWDQGTISTRTAWTRLAADVSAPVAPDDTRPFVLVPADATSALERLEVRLIATSGAGAALTKAKTDVTFTAMNTTVGSTTSSSSSTDVCAEGRNVP
jgi:type II secretory pathway component PulJ